MEIIMIIIILLLIALIYQLKKIKTHLFSIDDALEGVSLYVRDIKQNTGETIGSLGDLKDTLVEKAYQNERILTNIEENTKDKPEEGR